MNKRIVFLGSLLLGLSIICNFLFLDIVTAQQAQVYGYKTYSKNVVIEIDGEILKLDVQPMIVDDRTLVPFRKILEALGAKVDWYGETRKVTAIKDNLVIELRIDNKVALINKEATELEVPAMIVEGRTLIPARFIAEALGCSVDWNGNTRTVSIDTLIEKNSNKKEFSFQGIVIGDSEDKVIEALGSPPRKDLSKYGFTWYIYNGDYSKYIQIGIKDNKVVGIYTNARNWKSDKKITIGSTKKEVNSKYSNPLSGIKKGNTIYNLDTSQGDTYLIDDYYITIFYDKYNDNTVTAVLLIEKETEETLNSFFGEPSYELRKSYERQSIDLANAIRARHNKPAYIWDENISSVARKHSQDMGDRNYFSHQNPDGKSPFDRIENNNLKFIMAAENIAAGQPSAIIAHENWMNSEGHRKNILGDCKKMGVGVYLGGSYHIYYTQNFYTPKN